MTDDTTSGQAPNGGQFDPEDSQVVRKAVMDVERSARLARWFGTGLLLIGVLAMMASAVATVYMGVQVRGLLQEAVEEREEEARLREQEEARRTKEARREAELVNDIMTCLLGQFAEHRHASREFFNQSARHHGFPAVSVPAPTVPYNHDKVQMACDRSIRKLDDGG